MKKFSVLLLTCTAMLFSEHLIAGQIVIPGYVGSTDVVRDDNGKIITITTHCIGDVGTCLSSSTDQGGQTTNIIIGTAEYVGTFAGANIMPDLDGTTCTINLLDGEQVSQ
jgi:hypothetical protein